MTHHLAASHPILIAIPDAWQSFIVQAITQNGIPTLTLIKHGGNPIIIQVFDPPKHQYLTVPVAADEVIGLMRRARMIEESSL